MSSGKKLRILEDILGRHYKVSSEFLFHCPKCNHHKKKLSVNIEKDKFKCWICEYSGSTIYRLVRRLGNFKQQQQWEEFTGKVDLSSFDQQVHDALNGTKETFDAAQHTPLPEEFISLTGKNLPSSAAPALKFLINRGVTTEDLLKWKMGYCTTGKYANRVVFPSFDSRGAVNYFVARTYKNSSWKKYTNPPAGKDIVFNELYVDWNNDLSLVEGVLDAVVAGNAIPILGSSLHENSKLFKEIVRHDTPIYIALDADAEKKCMKLIKKLLTFGVELYKIDISPYSDVGEMSKQEYAERMAAAKLMDSQSYLSEAIAAI
jgi:hypothetical protein